jgi:hypothetical protein
MEFDDDRSLDDRFDEYGTYEIDDDLYQLNQQEADDYDGENEDPEDGQLRLHRSFVRRQLRRQPEDDEEADEILAAEDFIMGFGPEME